MAAGLSHKSAISESVKVRGVALLDMTARNGEEEDGSSGRNLYSAEYILQVAGMPYFVTDDMEEAIKSSRMMLFSSPVSDTSFSTAEFSELQSWVSDGGVIISPACTSVSDDITALFGITSSLYIKSRHTIEWGRLSENPA